MESMKTVICNKLRDLDKKCDKYQLYDKDDEYLVRFKDQYNKLYTWDEEEGSHRQLMELFAKTVMDLTFYEENKLTSDDFQSPNSKEAMYEIIDNLNEIEALTMEYTEHPVTLLGEEIIECILWRKGALLYMFCVTTVEMNWKGAQSDFVFFFKCLHESVKYLEKMVNVRKPLRVAPNMVEYNDEDTYFLLSEGIYSDTTLLALAYIGELCYWFCKYYDATKTSVDVKVMVATGKQALKRYIRTCEGPLKAKGWVTTKAKEHLAYIVSYKCT